MKVNKSPLELRLVPGTRSYEITWREEQMCPCSDERPGDRERSTSAWTAMGLLCEIMESYERHERINEEQARRLVNWWREHQASDAKYR